MVGPPVNSWLIAEGSKRRQECATARLMGGRRLDPKRYSSGFLLETSPLLRRTPQQPRAQSVHQRVCYAAIRPLASIVQKSTVPVGDATRCGTTR